METKLLALVPNPTSGLINNKDLVTKKVKGGVVVELANPVAISEDHMLLINCFEHKIGECAAQVVCGISGKKLRPYFYKDGIGHFSVPVSVIVVQAHFKEREYFEIDIFQFNANTEENRLERKLVWNGDLFYLPDIFKMYSDAAFAAYSKAIDVENNSLFYAEI
jgi:hypothetical protein